MNESIRLHERLRQEKYTGENRCIPCTIVNIIIAIAISTVVMYFNPYGALFVMTSSLAVIYLRGYLVPGTPTLIKEYTPNPLLQIFHTSTSAESISDNGNNSISILESVDAIQECSDGTDICLTLTFRREWIDTIEEIRSQEIYDKFIDYVGITENDISIARSNDIFVDVSESKRIQWGTETALIADAAAAGILSERHSQWSELPIETKHDLLKGLRIFLESCPHCDGNITVTQENVKNGCCSAMRISVIKCEDCEDKLLEGDISNINEFPG